MPMYDYRCEACDETFEARQKISEDPLTTCRLCGADGQVYRVISNTSFVLKGSGWYQTDYAGKGKPKEGGDGAAAAGGDAKSGKSEGGESGGKAKDAGKGEAASSGAG